MNDQESHLTICQLGNPILRDLAQPIHQIQTPEIQELIDQLIITVTSANGVGIAAPQVGVSQQLIIIASRPNLRYPQAPLMKPTAMINPKIVHHSVTMIKDWEGCLSVPGIRGLVPRYQFLQVEYLTKEGIRKQQTLTGFVARIFQHEYDHLLGKVFLDRVETTEDLITEQEYQKRFIHSQIGETKTPLNSDQQ